MNDCTPRPRQRSSILAEEAFRRRLAELGAQLLEPYKGARAPHHVRCGAGHDNYPMPTNVAKGRGICGTCAGLTAAGAEERFRARLAEFGAVLLGAYVDNSTPIAVRCSDAHEYLMSWASLQGSSGPCRICAGHDPATAEAGFRVALAQIGATLLESRWLGASKPHHVRCAAGHDCYPWPTSVQQGRGICITCAGMDPVAAEAGFRARVEALGGECLFTGWSGCNAGHHVRCKDGHDCYPRPGHVQQGRGICRTCAGQDPASAETAFRAVLAAAGATLLEPCWTGNNNPHRIRCAKGHESSPYPGNVQQGGGICAKCAGREWDVFYVLTNADESTVKFGITSREGRLRLSHHASQGYSDVVRLVAGLPGSVAPDTERAVKAALAAAGEKPVHGKEYFRIEALALVLDVADGWLTAA